MAEALEKSEQNIRKHLALMHEEKLVLKQKYGHYERLSLDQSLIEPEDGAAV